MPTGEGRQIAWRTFLFRAGSWRDGLLIKGVREIIQIVEHFAVTISTLFAKPRQHRSLVQFFCTQMNLCELPGVIAGIEMGVQIIEQGIQLLGRDRH